MKRGIPLFLLLALLSCARKARGPISVEYPTPLPIEEVIKPAPRERSPRIRIGIDKGKTFYFESPGRFYVYRDGILLYSGDPGKYRVSLRKPRAGKLETFEIVGESRKLGEARVIAESFASQGFRVKIVRIGRIFKLAGGDFDNRKYLVLRKPVRNHGGRVDLLKRPPGGKVILEDIGGKKLAEGDLFIRIIPAEGSPLYFVLDGIKVGEGFSWEKKVRRSYRGILEFRVSNRGKLLLINELPLEEYLKGVLPAEMGPAFPEEALKAQAVVARSEALSMWGLKLNLIAEPYDFTDDVFSQVYSGITHRTEKTDRAVNETKGEVLLYRGEIVNAVYHSCCGGHTENSEEVWGTYYPYLRGVPDNESELSPDLRDEDNLRRWLKDARDSYCDLEGKEGPPGLSFGKKNFRWTVTLTSGEIRKYVKRKRGVDPGKVLDLIPLHRGVSGRITSLKIVGTKRDVVINGELNVRGALSRTYLKSSLFVIEKFRGSDGNVFVLRGGGFGHGVGMCQMGAGMMAYRGKDYREILRHYFTGVDIAKIY